MLRTRGSRQAKSAPADLAAPRRRCLSGGRSPGAPTCSATHVRKTSPGPCSLRQRRERESLAVEMKWRSHESSMRRWVAEQSETRPTKNQGRRTSAESAIARAGRHCWRSAVFAGARSIAFGSAISCVNIVSRYRYLISIYR